MPGHPQEDLAALPDRALVERATQGDREAFGVLYQRYVQRIYNYIYYRVGHAVEAEDLTARVFYRAMRSMPRYKERGLPFSAFLYRIAHNLVANWHRDSKRRPEIPLEDAWLPPRAEGDPEDKLILNEERERLLQAIRRLPPERQELLIFKFVDRLSNAEIGQIMGRSEGAIKSLYHRTLVALRAELRRVQEEEG
ncbi:MAG TPA: sigma-70 family RNA polymerase sigma factor [Anaerolineae bacterium]|nr:sigma-70 family RNA polymerase sigma factor [Anaerolineae bacterium]HIQ08750.1 sigma-70 family RNA polymerase sigma factor [Anaerolineaceae bacterium]